MRSREGERGEKYDGGWGLRRKKSRDIEEASMGGNRGKGTRPAIRLLDIGKER